MSDKQKGLLIVISGFSGVGKGTLVRGLTDRYDSFALSVSVTTREPREGEKDGEAYFFITREEFEKMIADDALIEYAKYVGNYYGTPQKYVEDRLAEGKHVILEIEIQGALKIRRKFPDAVLVFVIPPSLEELRKRLAGRGTEDEETINRRLRRAVDESEGIELYDYIIVNDQLDDGIEALYHIVETELNRTARKLPSIDKLQKELKNLWKGE